MKQTTFVLLCGGLTLFAQRALGWDSYQGVHPPGGSGTFCQIDRPHFHSYAPNDTAAHWRSVRGAYRFVGDPTLFQYEGTSHKYFHHHPLPFGPDGPDGEFCFIDEAHSHVFGTGNGAGYVVVDGVSFFIGDRLDQYESERVKRSAQTQFYAKAAYPRFSAPKAPEVWSAKWSAKEPHSPADPAPEVSAPPTPALPSPPPAAPEPPTVVPPTPPSPTVNADKPRTELPRVLPGLSLLKKRKAKLAEEKQSGPRVRVPTKRLSLPVKETTEEK